MFLCFVTLSQNLMDEYSIKPEYCVMLLSLLELEKCSNFMDRSRLISNYLLIPASYKQVLHIFGILKPYAVEC